MSFRILATAAAACMLGIIGDGLPAAAPGHPATAIGHDLPASALADRPGAPEPASPEPDPAGSPPDGTAPEGSPPTGAPAAAPLLDSSLTADHPLHVRIAAAWETLEPARGQYDWAALDALIGRHLDAGYHVLLAVGGPNRAWDESMRLPGPAAPEVLKGWLDFLRQAALHFLGRPVIYEIGAEPNGPAGWAEAIADYAYVLKQSSVTIRSADPEALVVEGAVVAGDHDVDAVLAWQAALFDGGIATYVDALAVHPAAGSDAVVIAARFADLLLEHDPAAGLYMVSVTPRGRGAAARGADLVRQFAGASSAGATLVTFALGTASDGRPEGGALLLDLHRLFTPGMARRLGGGARFEPTSGGPDPIPEVAALSYFDGTTDEGLVVFEAAGEAAGGTEPVTANLVLDTAAVRGAAIYDLVGGSARAAEGARADFASNTTRVPVLLKPRPQILRYARVPIPGFEADKEALAVADTGLVTAEEVIAAHQRFMADQNYRLKTWSADARVEYHFKISETSTFDIAYDTRYFQGAEGGAEWQQNALYVNGVRWKGAFPTIPFVQPDKVLTLPLTINLDRAYSYEYLGRDRVDGREAHVVGFEPGAGGAALYSGKAWIDQRTGALLKTAVVEHGLTSPVVSNEETITYAPVAGPDGGTYWLMRRVDGQQVLLTAGRNLVLLRSIDFQGARINDPAFAGDLEAAHRSEAPMLKDTDRGLVTLTRGADGSRSLGGPPARSTLFAALGAWYQPGLDTPVPLAGIDYFSYELRGTPTQINAFLAGAVNLITLSRPRLLGPFDGTFEAQLVGVNFNDSYFVGGEEREASRINARPQSVAGWLGLPIGSFFRVAAGYEYEYRHYDRDAETDTFDVPTDTGVHVLGLSGEFNRAGWTVALTAERARRAAWEAWGDQTAPSAETASLYPSSPCDSPGSCLAEFDPGRDRYETWQARVAKQFFLPGFQKISLEARIFDGSNLDRFSQYQVEYFGPRVRGFSGGGVRFARGGIASVGYSFSIADVIRLEGGVDYARIRDPLEEDVDRDFTGAGIAGTVMGPWRSLLRFEAGVALQSDYEALRHEFEALVVLLKLF